VYSQLSTDRQTKQRNSQANMDLDAYIARYRGETRLQRLLHIGKATPDSGLANQAYELAEQQMKQDGNALRYKEVFGDGKPKPRSRKK
jgi:hypothetical protein